MRILGVLLLILNSVLALRAGAVSCEVASVKDRTGQARLYKIQFPDGRRLSVAGHQHTDRSLMWEMLGLPADKNLFPKVRMAIGTNNTKEALSYFEEDREFLRQAVKNEGARFIGVELADKRVGDWMARLRQFQDRALKYSAHSGDSEISLISKARLAAYGAPLAMPLEEPALFLKAPLFGIEDGEAVKDHGLAENALNIVFAQAENEIGQDKEWLEKLHSLPREMLLDHYPVYDPEVPKEEVIKPLLSKWPGKYRKSIHKVLEVFLYNFDLMYVRDNLSTENILKRNESGIIFIGAAHAKPIMLRLREECLKQQRHSEDLTSAIPAAKTVNTHQ